MFEARGLRQWGGTSRSTAQEPWACCDRRLPADTEGPGVNDTQRARDLADRYWVQLLELEPTLGTEAVAHYSPSPGRPNPPSAPPASPPSFDSVRL